MKKFSLFTFAMLTLILSANGHANEPDQAPGPTDPSCAEILVAPAKVRQPSRRALRNGFIHQYAELIFADELQNQAWIDDALLNNGKDFHILIENYWMKKLNDKILKNKDLVTALTNFHKKLFVEALSALGIKLKLDPYQDFKSIRLTLPKDATKDDIEKIKMAFTTANQQFYSDALLRKILRADDLAVNWFRMGIGRSETDAALAARYARDNAPTDGVADYADPSLQTELNEKLRQVKALHGLLMARLMDTGLTETTRAWTGLKLEIFAAARKATPEDFLETLEQLFPNRGIDQVTADFILTYANLSDEFSPTVLVAKRELLTINEAPFGAISIDFIGLGAENLRATTKALVTGKNLNDAIKRSRAYEQKVTKTFERLKTKVETAVKIHFKGMVSVRFSGDDGVIIPTVMFSLHDQMTLLERLARLMPRPYFRMAVINADGAKHQDSSQLITHGEGIEKNLRQLILQDFGARFAEDLSLGVFVPDAGKFRKTFLMIRSKRRFTPDEKTILADDFSRAVNLVQEQVQAQGLTIEYDPTDIFVIFRGRRNDELKGRGFR